MSRTRTTTSWLIAWALAAALAAAPALADQPSPPDEARLAAAKEVLVASGGRAEALRSLTAMRGMLIPQLRNQDPVKADAAEAKLSELLDPSSPWIVAYLDEMEGLAIEFYASHFTTEELKTISAFQSSTAGTKFRAVVPEMMASMAAPMYRFQHILMTEMQKP